MATTRNQTGSTTDQRIAALEPGAMIELSRNDRGVAVYAERSCDGTRVRIFRIHRDGEHEITDVITVSVRPQACDPVDKRDPRIGRRTEMAAGHPRNVRS